MQDSRWFFRETQSRASAADHEERRTLLRNLDDTKRELDLAYLGFNQATDPDLVEFYLFEVDALRARHSYLLRRVKQLTEDGEPPAQGE